MHGGGAPILAPAGRHDTHLGLKLRLFERLTNLVAPRADALRHQTEVSSLIRGAF
jgi:hypothetical protein